MKWFIKKHFFSKVVMKQVLFDISKFDGTFIEETELKDRRILKCIIIKELNDKLILELNNAISRMDFKPEFDIHEIKNRLEKGFFFSVAIIEDNIIGWTWGGVGTVFFKEFFSDIKLGDEKAFSYNNYLEKEYRGNDIFSVLVNNLVYTLKNNGYKEIWGLVYPWNIASLRAFRKSGWALTGEYSFLKVFGYKFHSFKKGGRLNDD